MAKGGYTVFKVRARVRRVTPAQYLLLDRLNDETDLLGLLSSAADLLRVEAAAVKNEAVEQAFRITASKIRGRSLHLEGRSGPYGSDGSLEDVDTGDASPITLRHAAMRNVRASFFIPEQSAVAILCLEMAGSTSLRRGLFQDVLQPLGRQFGFLPELTALQDPEAWSAFLNAGETRRVTRVYRPNTAGQLGAVDDDAGELRQVLSGGLAQQFGNRARRALGRRFAQQAQPAGDAVGVDAAINDDYGTLDVPEVSETFALTRTELDVRVGGQTRKVTVVNSEDGLPQFVYPFGTDNRPGANTMQDLFAAQAVKLYNRTEGGDLETSLFKGRSAVRGDVPEVTLE